MKHTAHFTSLVASLMVALGGISPASATLLTGKFNVDNGYVAYISTSDSVQGTQFSAGNNWSVTYSNTTNLLAGVDYFLHIYTYDQGGIAGFLGEFTLSGSDHKFDNNTTSLLTNTTDWSGNNTGWGNAYTSLVDLGANGVGPWGTRPDVSSQARWIWAGNADSNDHSWFSTRISSTAVAAVPEPTALSLLGLGLLGLGVLRRKC